MIGLWRRFSGYSSSMYANLMSSDLQSPRRGFASSVMSSCPFDAGFGIRQNLRRGFVSSVASSLSVMSNGRSATLTERLYFFGAHVHGNPLPVAAMSAAYEEALFLRPLHRPPPSTRAANCAKPTKRLGFFGT